MRTISPQTGFAALWALLIVFPSVILFSNWVRTLTTDFEVRESAFQFVQEVNGYLATNGNYERFLRTISLRYGDRVIINSASENEVRITLTHKSKNLNIIWQREPRTAIIFLDAGEYVAPIKQRHVDPEIWSLPHRVGVYQNFKPLSSGRDRDTGSFHFVDRDVLSNRYWLGPRFFLNLPSTMWQAARARVETKRYPDNALDCVSWCANRSDCVIEERDHNGQLILHHPPSYCLDCLERFQCYGQPNTVPCLQDAFARCIQNSKFGLATWQGQSCSNPVFTAMKVLATNLWYYYSQDSRNHVQVLTGPIDLSPTVGFGVADRDRVYDIFVGRPSPLAMANRLVIQNAIDIERAIIDQDCVLALHRDSKAYLSRLISNNPPNSNETHYFIHQPVPRSIRVKLSGSHAASYANGIRELPTPTLNSQGILVDDYRRQMTVPEGIFSQVAKQRHMGFNFLSTELANRLAQIPSDKNVDIFLILGDFPWFRLRDHPDESYAQNMDCMTSSPWVSGLLKIERTYERAGPGNRHRLHLGTVCPTIRESSLESYNQLLTRYMRMISSAIHPKIRGNLFIIVARSEGSFPSHGNDHYDCVNKICDTFRDHVKLFSRMLEKIRKEFSNLKIVFIPVNHPAAIAYELSVFLPSIVERSRIRMRVS